MSDFALPPLAPEATLISGAVGCGKTEATIDAILDARLFRPFSTIWVVLATGQQIHAFRERLLARSADSDTAEDRVQFGVEFFNFDTLYTRLLDEAGNPQRQVQDTARYQILRDVIGWLASRGDLEHYEPIAHTPGFIGLVAGLIHELKQGMALPERFAEVAETRGPKDRDLARIYTGYQAFLLDRRLVDRHGAGWLAVRLLEDHPALANDVDLLVIDGFDQFSQVQLQVLTALARRVSRTVLTLAEAPTAPGRHFRRLAQTRDRLLDAGESQAGEQLWRTWTLDDALGSGCTRNHPALDHLVGHLFHSGAAAHRDPGDAMTLLEAPDVGREVAAALRLVKRRLLDGTPPETVLIVARSMHQYAGALRETARAFGVPLVVRTGMRLRDNPAIALLLLLIDLAALDFPRREVLDTLHSPYFASPDLTPDAVALLERISLERQVVRGRATWLDAVLDAAHPRRSENRDESGVGLDSVTARELHEALARHFDRITPPADGTTYALVRWIMDLIGPDPDAAAEDEIDRAEDDPHTEVLVDVPDPAVPPDHLGLVACVRAGMDAERVARDMAALHEFRRVLRGIRAASDLLAGEGEPYVVEWGAFRAELELAVERARVTPVGGRNRLGRVLATDVLEARGLPHEHVTILSLSEGVFPAPESEDALYQESERVELEAAGIDMQTVLERSDDMSLFYQAVGLARETLTLTRFTVDDKGNAVPPSPYWTAVRSVVENVDVKRIPVGSAPGIIEAATLSEAAVALAAALSGEGVDAPDGDHGAAAHNALLERGAMWPHVLRARALEAWREDSAAPFDRHSGQLTEPDLIAAVGRLLGPERVWSASQFNDYGVCPFRFFARRLLRLEELQEPEEGLDVLQRGLLNHTILERTYAQVGAEGLAITPENQARALDILTAAAADVFADAPAALGFRPSAVWAQERAEIERRLVWLVTLDFSDDSPFRLRPRQRPDAHPVAAAIGDDERVPFAQEAVFGLDGEPPVEIAGPAGVIQARGVIDRLDRAGDSVIVVDYKSGTTPHPVDDMASGRDYQMILYLLAARALLDRAGRSETVLGGLFCHIANRQVSGEVLANDAAVDAAREHLHAQVQAARAGRFVVSPNKLERGRCVSYCEFGALCRLSRGYLHKPADPAAPSTTFPDGAEYNK
ncbi:MAG: hypothetical protein GYB65_08720 [Chloroflexi bacterium]|nr:hypothetical protein [Chloroflexota bacterium]